VTGTDGRLDAVLIYAEPSDRGILEVPQIDVGVCSVGIGARQQVGGVSCEDDEMTVATHDGFAASTVWLLAVRPYLGVAKDSIYRWIERRSLPAHRIDRLWKFKISEVNEWVRAGGAESDGLDKGDKR
jgi:excisionase family DNA binding protein